jgi:transcription elongation GreA/GreB family factor
LLIFTELTNLEKQKYGKQVLKDIQENRRELDQNTSDYIDAKTRLEETTRRYKMAEKLLKRELVESQNAIKVIKSKDLKHE